MRNSFAGESGETNLSHEFGEFRFDPRKRVLWRNGGLVYLPPKSAELLTVLLERRGEVLERGELIDLVWKDTFVEEGNLSYTISRLRKVVGEEFIQTIPRRGYRFVDQPHANRDSDADFIYEKHSLTETVVEEIHISDPTTSRNQLPASVHVPRKLMIGLGLVLLCVAIGVVWRSAGKSAVDNSSIRSIAILPFKNVGAADNEHRGLALADLLITRLSALRKLSVRPTSAVMSFEDRVVDAAEAANSLAVDAVLEGTIYRSGDHVRITARLMSHDHSSPMWTAEIERPVADELGLQNEIARQLVDALAIKLSDAEANALAKNYTDNPDAYRLYAQGRYHWNKRSYQGLAEAQLLFRKAIEADPKFVLAYVGLADSMVFVDRNPEMGGALGKAFELDPASGEAYATMGIDYALNSWEWDQGEEYLRKSVELNPGYATAHHWLAIVLGIKGRTEEAKAEMNRALEIDPTSYNFLADLGQIYYFERDYETAKQYCQKALAINPDFPFAHEYLSKIYFRTGEYESAIEEEKRTMFLLFTSTTQTDGLAYKRQAELDAYSDAYRAGGLRGYWSTWKATQVKNGAMNSPNAPYTYARMHASLGEREKALESLEKAFEQKPFLMAWVKVDPVFDVLRSEPRYQAILRKMKL